MTYRVEVRPSARRDFDRLPLKVFDAVVAFMAGPLSENPHRVGKPLRNEFEGLFSSRVGTYRILYEIDDVVRVVAIMRIAHRSGAYR